jgi:uncharacterized protein
MAQFLVEYQDIGTPEARAEHRAEHIAYRKGLGAAMLMAGPLLDDAGNPDGSLVLLEAPDRAAAEQLALDDPYMARGVLQLKSIRGYRVMAMNPPAAEPR